MGNFQYFAIPQVEKPTVITDSYTGPENLHSCLWALWC